MMERKDILIAVGVTVGAAVLVLFMRKPATSGGGGGTGSQDIAGGFATASTVYVPTTSYNIAYNNNKGTISYSTVDNTTTTTYSNSPGPIVHLPDPPPPPPIVTSNGGTTNPPTSQTGTTPTAPAPAAPAPPAHTTAPAMMGNIHYATPAGGWNPNSVVDYIKEHGGDSSFANRSKLAAADGIGGYQGTAAQNLGLLAKLRAQYGN